VSQSISHSLIYFIGRSVDHATFLTVTQPSVRSVGQTLHYLVSQLITQSIDWSVIHSLIHSLAHPFI
jgi:hypothetical protein